MENPNGMGMTPYEQFVMAEKTSRHRTSGTAIAGLVLGTVGTAIAAVSCVVMPMYTNARVKAAEAKNEGTSALLNQMAQLLAAERAERVQGDINLTATINDTVSGQQSGQLSASQVATNEATAQIMAGVMTGEYSKAPQKVELMTPAQPFQCGCGCQG
jgi:hypothetical protein